MQDRIKEALIKYVHRHAGVYQHRLQGCKCIGNVWNIFLPVNNCIDWILACARKTTYYILKLNQSFLKLLCSLIFLSGLFCQALSAADQFGRLFTTPGQREHLDELRKIKPEQRVTIEEQILVIEEDTEEEQVPADALTVRGLVYRSDGKSTAWINDSNTFEGGVSSQYMDIGDIETNKVEIKIPAANTSVKLNVGQTFDPASESYRDLVEDSATTVIDAGSVSE